MKSETDTLAAVENATGSPQGDTLTGDGPGPHTALAGGTPPPPPAANGVDLPAF